MDESRPESGGSPRDSMELNIQSALINVILLWILTTPHEFAHAWAATKLGDDTPRIQGRLTLYPLAHVDWLGTAILPFITSLLTGGFLGWGKPVFTDTRKLKWGLNGMALVALAGPFSNVIMAFLLAVAAKIALLFFEPAAQFAIAGAQLSLYLALFNLLPVPPLDGSKLLLAMRVPISVYRELARFGFMLLVIAISFYGIGQWMDRWSAIGTAAIYGLLP